MSKIGDFVWLLSWRPGSAEFSGRDFIEGVYSTKEAAVDAAHELRESKRASHDINEGDPVCYLSLRQWTVGGDCIEWVGDRVTRS